MKRLRKSVLPYCQCDLINKVTLLINYLGPFLTVLNCEVAPLKSEVQMSPIVQLIDCYFYQGIEMIFRIGLAILKLAEPDLLSLDMEGMITVSQGFFTFRAYLYVETRPPIIWMCKTCSGWVEISLHW